MREQVILSMKDQRKLEVLRELDGGRLVGREAAQLLGVSLRQTRRLLAAYRQKGVEAVVHGNRGRTPVTRTSEEIHARVLALARSTYRDYNDQHFTEELAAQHGIVLSRSTVRRIRRQAELASPRTRKAPRHRCRRERYPQSGMLLQIDGSDHDWLEGRGPRLTLIAAIDDATNEVPYALFRDEEDATGYFLLVRHIATSHGLPMALYADRHTIFQSPLAATIEQQLSGQTPQSQFGRLLSELAIQLIAARSPQAKGRVERLFATLQDRLVKALRQAGATTLEEANAVLAEFLPRFNLRFAKPAAQPGSAYRPLPAHLATDLVFSFKHLRTVAHDNTISFAGVTLQIPPGRDRSSYAKARVQVHQYLDGRIAICYQDQVLTIIDPQQPGPVRVGKLAAVSQTPLPSAPPTQPVEAPPPQPTRRRSHKPAADHPWRKPIKPQQVAEQPW